ncbi:MAG: 3-isopropylmalate dehydrogenase [Candidatus Peribacteraceae bacterium]|nr:3-isopropylmalate dehydrogenase [Candidatus Peribacteraceae bacterium]
MRKRIALLPGDGIGPEVMAEAVKVLDAVAKKFKHSFTYEEAPVGGAAFDVCGEHLPQSTLDVCRRSDAVLYGSVGGPVNAQDQLKWKDAEKHAILGIRKALNLSINVRPAVVYNSLAHLSPLKDRIIEKGVDILIIRELLGDVYFGERGTKGKRAWDVMDYTEDQIAPVIEFACQAARKRRKNVTVVDKANVLDTSRLWRKVAGDISPRFSDVAVEFLYVDNACMQLVTHPSRFDVIATSNLFGDIVSDVAATLPGSLGLMPSASLGNKVHLFEPIGGSAPDIAGRGVANPVAQILSAGLMLRHSFGMESEAVAIESAVKQAIEQGARTGDIALKGEAVLGTKEMGDRIALLIDR